MPAVVVFPRSPPRRFRHRIAELRGTRIVSCCGGVELERQKSSLVDSSSPRHRWLEAVGRRRAFNSLHRCRRPRCVALNSALSNALSLSMFRVFT